MSAFSIYINRLHPFLSDRNWFRFRTSISSEKGSVLGKEILVKVVIDPIKQCVRLFRNNLEVFTKSLPGVNQSGKTIFFELKSRGKEYCLYLPDQTSVIIEIDQTLDVIESSQWLGIYCYRGIGKAKRPINVPLLDSITGLLPTQIWSDDEQSDTEDHKSEDNSDLESGYETDIENRVSVCGSSFEALDSANLKPMEGSISSDSEQSSLDESVNTSDSSHEKPDLLNESTSRQLKTPSRNHVTTEIQLDVPSSNKTTPSVGQPSALFPVSEYLTREALNRPIRLSFCTTCLKRLVQIQQTLPRNLQDNIGLSQEIEFVVVDFGTPGLYEWVYSHFEWALRIGYLRYIRTDALAYWHASIAKNTSHKIARGKILVNLDCDNYTGRNGAEHVLRLFQKYGNDILFHQWSGVSKDGTYGRIAYHRTTFFRLGGYDESFLPMGYQDHDIIRRFQMYYESKHKYPQRGLSHINSGYYSYENLQLRREKIRHYFRHTYSQAIANDKGKSMVNTQYHKKLKWSTMNSINQQKSHNNIMHHRVRVNTEKQYLGVQL